MAYLDTTRLAEARAYQAIFFIQDKYNVVVMIDRHGNMKVFGEMADIATLKLNSLLELIWEV